METMNTNKKAEMVGKLFKLFEAGYPVSEIATELGIPESTVRYYLEFIDNDTTK